MKSSTRAFEFGSTIAKMLGFDGIEKGASRPAPEESPRDRPRPPGRAARRAAGACTPSASRAPGRERQTPSCVFAISAPFARCVFLNEVVQWFDLLQPFFHYTERVGGVSAPSKIPEDEPKRSNAAQFLPDHSFDFI